MQLCVLQRNQNSHAVNAKALTVKHPTTNRVSLRRLDSNSGQADTIKVKIQVQFPLTWLSHGADTGSLSVRSVISLNEIRLCSVLFSVSALFLSFHSCSLSLSRSPSNAVYLALKQLLTLLFWASSSIVPPSGSITCAKFPFSYSSAWLFHNFLDSFLSSLK